MRKDTTSCFPGRQVPRTQMTVVHGQRPTVALSGSTSDQAARVFRSKCRGMWPRHSSRHEQPIQQLSDLHSQATRRLCDLHSQAIRPLCDLHSQAIRL